MLVGDASYVVVGEKTKVICLAPPRVKANLIHKRARVSRLASLGIRCTDHQRHITGGRRGIGVKAGGLKGWRRGIFGVIRRLYGKMGESFRLEMLV